MSDEDNPFRFVPAVQHMAIVKTIETLSRDSKLKNIMKSMALNIHRRNYYDRDMPELNSLIEELEEKVDLLPMPKVLKISLKSFLLSMLHSATRWLVDIVRNTPWEIREQYWEESTGDLVGNLQWNNFGFVDGWKILKSYVSKRKIINFLIWNQLCSHCMEDDIIKFSSTINWNDCTGCFNSFISMYWYHKIYGKFPTKEMYRPHFYDYLEHRGDYEHMHDEKKIVWIMLNHCIFIPKTTPTVSAIMYFQNYLNDEEFDRLVAALISKTGDASLLLYVLRTLKKYILLNTILKIEVVHYLMELPLTLFIDDWISVFETIDATSFIRFFDCIVYIWTNRKHDPNRTLSEAIEKIWRIYLRKFDLDSKSISRVFFGIFYRQDVVLFELMFKELEDHQRLLFIIRVKDYVENSIGERLDKRFSVEFAKQVLKNNEERKLFSEIPTE